MIVYMMWGPIKFTSKSLEALLNVPWPAYRTAETAHMAYNAALPQYPGIAGLPLRYVQSFKIERVS